MRRGGAGGERASSTLLQSVPLSPGVFGGAVKGAWSLWSQNPGSADVL